MLVRHFDAPSFDNKVLLHAHVALELASEAIIGRALDAGEVGRGIVGWIICCDEDTAGEIIEPGLFGCV